MIALPAPAWSAPGAAIAGISVGRAQSIADHRAVDERAGHGGLDERGAPPRERRVHVARAVDDAIDRRAHRYGPFGSDEAQDMQTNASSSPWVLELHQLGRLS